VNVHVCLGWEKFPYEGPQALINRKFYTCQYDADQILYVALEIVLKCKCISCITTGFVNGAA